MCNTCHFTATSSAAGQLETSRRPRTSFESGLLLLQERTRGPKRPGSTWSYDGHLSTPLHSTVEPTNSSGRAKEPLLVKGCIDRSQPFVSSQAHLGRLGGDRPIELVTASADSTPNAKGLALRPPMRCLRLGSILQSSAPST